MDDKFTIEEINDALKSYQASKRPKTIYELRQDRSWIHQAILEQEQLEKRIKREQLFKELESKVDKQDKQIGWLIIFLFVVAIFALIAFGFSIICLCHIW